LLFLSASDATAQTAQRSAITGVVTDTSHGVIAGATVTVSGPGLPGGSVVDRTDGRGDYHFTALLPGDYVVAIAADGFSTATRKVLQLPVETTFTLDVTLDVSALFQSVDVEGSSPLIDVRTAASPTTLPNSMLQDLPTSRSLVELLNFAPGIGTGIVYSSSQGSSIAYGGTQGSNGVTLDGVSIVESHHGDARIGSNYDWIDQIQVVALGANAETGASTTGATVNGVLRSGTNRFTGLADYFWTQPGWTSDNTSSLPDFLQNSRKPVPPTTWFDTGGQLGGPLVRDRLWFFSGIESLHRAFTPLTRTDGQTDERHLRALLKIDAAPASHVRLQGFYMRDASDTDGYGNETHIASSQVATVRSHVWNARATWSLASNSLIDAHLAGFLSDEDDEPRPPFSRAGPPMVFDYAGSDSGANGFFVLHQKSVSAATSVTHTASGFGRIHEIKAGIEYEDAPTDILQGYSGGVVYVASAGVLKTADFWNGSDSRTRNRRATLFAQDHWTVIDRVTIEGAIRFDFNRGSVPTLGTVIATSPVGPRLGVAWDVGADHRTVVRAHYGRYFDQLFGALYQYKDVSGFSPHVRYQMVDGQVGPLSSVDAPPQDVVIPSDVRQPHVDQWTAGAERQIGRNLSAELQYVRRNFGHFIGYVDPQLHTYPLMPVQDPGPDGILGTEDDGGTFQVAQVPSFGSRTWYLTNPADAWRTYNAVQMVARKRLADHWQLQASYSWSRSSDTIDNIDHTNLAQGTLSPLAGVGGNPNVANQGPGQPTFAFSEGKTLVSWEPPWWGGFILSSVARWQTGVRWNRSFIYPPAGYPVINAEPVGSRVGPSIKTIDLRAEKTVTARGKVVGLTVDVFNVANAAAPLSISGFSGPTYGLPFYVIPPRQVRAGIRLRF
jgi:hypothetical protein